MDKKTKNILKKVIVAAFFVVTFFIVSEIANAAEKYVDPEDKVSTSQPISKDKMAPLETTEKSPDFSDGWYLKPVKWLLYWVLVFVGWLVSLAATILGWILNPELWGEGGFMEKDIVYQTWGTFRDIFNMGFILMLLFSAFATIFQVDKFNIKKIFLSVLLAVLLINFSFPIARIIIDISNVMMFSFMNGTSGIQVAVDFSSYSNIGDALVKQENYSKFPIPYLLASIVFVFIFGVTLLVLAVLLLVRLIALMALIIVSPVGFAGSVFPGVSGFSSKWWNALFNYSFFGPFMVLVLMVALKMMDGISEEAKIGLLAKANQNAPTGMGADFATWLAQAAFYTVPIMILWMGMGIARSMSIAGAGMVVGMGEKFSKWTGKHLTGYSAMKYAGGALVKKIDRDYIGVRGFLKAWKDRTAELETDKIGYQTARSRDLLGSVFDRGKRDPDFYKRVDDANKIAKYKKEQDLFSTTDVDMIAGIENLRGQRDMESGQRMQAFFQTMAGNKDLNEFEKRAGRTFDPVTAKTQIANTLRTTMDERGVVEAMHDLEDINITNGVYSMYGLTHVLEAADVAANPNRGTVGQRVISTANEQADAVMGKLQNLDFQKFMINFHPNSVITEAPNGDAAGISPIGHRILDYVERMGAAHVNRLRGDAKLKIIDAIRLDTLNGGDIPRRNPTLMAALGVPVTATAPVTPTPASVPPVIGPLTMENPDLN